MEKEKILDKMRELRDVRDLQILSKELENINLDVDYKKDLAENKVLDVKYLGQIEQNVEVDGKEEKVLKDIYLLIEQQKDKDGNLIQIEKYYNEEVRRMAFSELYTKAQAIIRTLSACSVGAQILTSRELIDLLYVAYNRDEAETYGIDRAIKAGYNELYSTSQDVFAKKIKALDEEIEEKAIDLANSKVEKAKSMLQENAEKKEQNMDELIDELAEIILKDNKSYLGSDISDAAIAELEKDKEENHEVSKKKTKTRNKSAN